MFANENDFRENNFFPVFGCILENSLKNILQCLVQRKMKKKKKTQLETHYNPTINHCKPPKTQSETHKSLTRKKKKN
jgi:hypothetical protein